MGSLGFRPPQFSEELAWLPTWLQHPHVEASIDVLKEAHTTSDRGFEDLVHLQGEMGCGKGVDILSSEEGRYNSCHLFLSGEDNSPNIVAPSPQNVLHLYLHLSSDGDSQYSQSQLLYTSQAVQSSCKVLPLQQVETSAGLQEKTCQLKMDPNSGGVNFSPVTSLPKALENGSPQSPTNNKDTKRQHEGKMDYNADGVQFSLPKSMPTTVENVDPLSPTNHKDSGQWHKEKINARSMKDADVSDAVELSIAASEAVVIHELMKTGSASEVLPMGAILEAALQVKQARLEALENAFCGPSDEINVDLLSDLDDLIMMDAFLDVGLSFSGLDDHHACGSNISQVKDTPDLENIYGHHNGSEHIQLIAQQDEIYDPVLGLKTSNVDCPAESVMYQPAEDISHLLAVAQPQVDVNSSHVCISEATEGEDKVRYLVSNRFRSRWLGGWTAKEADASTKLKQSNNNNIKKGIPNFFVGETSSLSESADVAPDENSYVQKHETGTKIASQSSIPFEHLCGEVDEEILISQDDRSNLLSVDPLCSAVPCSISLENEDLPLAQNQNDRAVGAQSCSSPKSELGMKNFQRTSNLHVKSVCVDGQDVPTITGECSGALVRRQLASLKTYSTLPLQHDFILEGGRPYNIRQFPTKFVGQLLSSDNEENLDATVMRNPFTQTTNQKRSHDEPAKVGRKHIQTSVQSRSPLILNRRTRCRLQPSEHFVKSLTGEENSEEAIAQETMPENCQSKNLQTIQSRSKGSHGIKNAVRRRVHFSEVEVKLQQKKDIQKSDTTHRNSSTIRANKRLRYSNPCLESQTQNMESYFSSHIKDVKRLIFHGLEFLLTGFSSQKEKTIMQQIQTRGGIVLSDIPSPPLNSRAKSISRSNLHGSPIIICSKKLQTTKFLYGCAVNALILKVKWLNDSIAVGSVVAPEKYMILSQRADLKKCIFDRVGIMLHGKHSFCTKLATTIKHGGGQVFKSLQQLFQSLDTERISVGAIIAEDASRALRHLRHCASERKIPMMPASWIAKSLHSGKLIPFKEEDDIPSTIKVQEFIAPLDWSEEI